MSLFFRIQVWFLAGCLILGLMGMPESAHAAMIFCNRSSAAIEAALGYREMDEDHKQQWISEGWWHIEPGQCSRVYGKPLTQRFYYYYGVSLATPPRDKTAMTWGGKFQFCADTKAFRATGDSACDKQGLQSKGFQQIDVGANTRDYTLDFHDGN
jgi:uncharacterized membrane protein